MLVASVKLIYCVSNYITAAEILVIQSIST